MKNLIFGLFYAIIIFLILAFLLFIAIIVVILAGSKDSGEIFSDDTPVVVPGCKIIGDRPRETLKNRLDAAKTYLYEHKNARCVVCGGKYGEFTQAQVMKNYLVSAGIASERIFCDNSSATTFENMKNARSFLPDTINIFIATNAYHQYRSKLFAAKFGFRARPLIAKTPLLQIFYSFVREAPAVLKAWIKDS